MPDGDFGFYMLLWALGVSVFGLIVRIFFF